MHRSQPCACYHLGESAGAQRRGQTCSRGSCSISTATLLDIDFDSFFRAYFAALGPRRRRGARQRWRHPQRAQRRRARHTVHEPSPSWYDQPRDLQRTLPGADRHGLGSRRMCRGVSSASTLKSSQLCAAPSVPAPGLRAAVRCALDLGLKVAIATNPIFPRSAIIERMRWAEVADLPFHVVTSYENMHAAKPHPAYFSETAALLGVTPSEALMVGDDRVLDMCAADVGMRTYYVGHGVAPAVDFVGTLEELTDLMPRLVKGES